MASLSRSPVDGDDGGLAALEEDLPDDEVRDVGPVEADPGGVAAVDVVAGDVVAVADLLAGTVLVPGPDGDRPGEVPDDPAVPVGAAEEVTAAGDALPEVEASPDEASERDPGAVEVTVTTTTSGSALLVLHPVSTVASTRPAASRGRTAPSRPDRGDRRSAVTAS